MTKVIAISEIHRTVKPGKRADKAAGTAAVKPEVQIIPPGAVVSPNEKEMKEWRALKAIRDIRPGEQVGVSINPDDNDTEMAAKIAAARAGMAEPVGEHAGNAEDAKPAKGKTKAATEAKPSESSDSENLV